jgi:glycosyltransferase involved in cell wall biosynthesis
MRLKEEPDYTGAVGIEAWIQTVAASLDVGMVPLAPTAFNTAKSRLKGIEYMAAGVAWVSSPREEYRKLNRESGCGLLADNPKQWYQHLKRLMDDEALRKEQVEMGREFMKTQTIQAHAHEWAEAWQRAMEIQRGQ